MEETKYFANKGSNSLMVGTVADVFQEETSILNIFKGRDF